MNNGLPPNDYAMLLFIPLAILIWVMAFYFFAKPNHPDYR